MAQPSKRRPYAIEVKYPTQPDKWYGLEAYADKAEAEAMLLVFAKRGQPSRSEVRLRDIREPE